MVPVLGILLLLAENVCDITAMRELHPLPISIDVEGRS